MKANPQFVKIRAAFEDFRPSGMSDDELRQLESLLSESLARVRFAKRQRTPYFKGFSAKRESGD